MADSGITVATPGGNVVVSTDEFSGSHHERVKIQHGTTGSATDVSSGSPLPVSDAALATALASLLTELGQKLEPADVAALATGSKQDTAKAVLDTIAGKDFATQTTLAALLTELGQKLEPSDLSALATAAKQDTLKTAVDAVTAKLIAAPATEAKQDSLKTSTDAITTKLTSDPSTATNQAANGTKLDTLHTDNGGPGSSQPSLVNGGTGILGYLRNVLDALRGTLTVNNSQVAGATVDTNSGSKSAGTQRVVLATDQPQLTAALKVDGSAVTQPVSGTVAVSAATPAATAPGQLRKTVTTAGTAVALNGSTLRIRRGVLCALSTNQGVVVVGGSGVIAAVGTRNSPYLNAGDTIELGSVDLAATYIDATVPGEGATVYYEA